MEPCGTKDVEASGGDSPMARCPTKSLKAAAAAKEEAAAAAKQAEGNEFQKEAAGDDDDDDDTDSEDEGDGMTSLEYIKTYKMLPPFEVQCLLKHPLERTPFTDSYVFKALSADPNATLEDIKLAFEEHEDGQDMRMRFCERVRTEYEANGYVTVSDEYIAWRVRNNELCSKLWEEAFADFNDEVAGFDNEVNVEEVAH